MFRANLRAKLTTAVPPQNEMSPCRRTCFGPPCTSVILLKAKDEYDRSNGRNGIPELLTSMMRAGCRAREQGLHVTSCDRMVGESCTTNAFSKCSPKQFSLYPNIMYRRSRGFTIWLETPTVYSQGHIIFFIPSLAHRSTEKDVWSCGLRRLKTLIRPSHILDLDLCLSPRSTPHCDSCDWFRPASS